MQSKRDECELRGYTTQYLMSSTHIVIYNRRTFKTEKKIKMQQKKKNKEEVNKKFQLRTLRSFKGKRKSLSELFVFVCVWVQFLIDS